MFHIKRSLIAVLCVSAAALSSAQTLRVGLAEDPDVLDPTLARTFVGRIVFSALCDKLVDVDEKLNLVPQLALSWQWSADNKTLTMKLRPGVTFHDGEKLDAAAVKFNLERHKTLAGSNRRGELAPLASVDVVDPLTVRLNLTAPFSPLLAALSDRAGMMVSPKAAQAGGGQFWRSARVLWTLQICGTCGPRSHGFGALRRLLEQSRSAFPAHRLHPHHRCHRSLGQPQIRSAGHHRTFGTVGR